MAEWVEDRLGLRLLNRTTRHVAPTPVGERLLERLHPVLEGLESALEELTPGPPLLCG
jgi:DNA-binding transcriptional LysR family regulator